MKFKTIQRYTDFLVRATVSKTALHVEKAKQIAKENGYEPDTMTIVDFHGRECWSFKKELEPIPQIEVPKTLKLYEYDYWDDGEEEDEDTNRVYAEDKVYVHEYLCTRSLDDSSYGWLKHNVVSIAIVRADSVEEALDKFKRHINSLGTYRAIPYVKEIVQYIAPLFTIFDDIETI